jgi:site-specific recombinase XerC
VNIEQPPDGRYRLRWYLAGRGSPRRQKTFPAGTRKKQVETYAANLEVRRAMGEPALYEQRRRPLRDLSREWWAKYAVPNLAEWTRIGYKRMLVKHIEPRLGAMPVGEITPEVVAEFRVRLDSAGVGRHSVRQSLVVLQAMYEQAIRWGWVPTNPVKAVKKPPAKRERAVVCLAPNEVEAIRAVLVARERLYAATMVSLVAYQGLRVPEELLALECRHVRPNTLLVEQTQHRRQNNQWPEGAGLPSAGDRSARARAS